MNNLGAPPGLQTRKQLQSTPSIYQLGKIQTVQKRPKVALFREAVSDNLSPRQDYFRAPQGVGWPLKTAQCAAPTNSNLETQQGSHSLSLIAYRFFATSPRLPGRRRSSSAARAW